MPSDKERQERYKKLQERRSQTACLRPDLRFLRLADPTQTSAELLKWWRARSQCSPSNINEFFAEVRDYRKRNDLRLEQVEEAMRHREEVAQEAPSACDDDDRLRERDEIIRQLRDQLQEQE